MLDGKLQRKVARGRYEPIEPESISSVREYMCGQAFTFFNGFLVVVSDGKKYGVSVFDDEFDEIVDFIEQNTTFEIRSRAVYHYNKFCGLLHKPLSLSRLLFFWRKKKDP